MNAPKNDSVLKQLTDEKFELSQRLSQLESKEKDTQYVELRIEKVNRDINSIILK